MSEAMSHSQPSRKQRAMWDRFPDTRLGISGVGTRGRCWHRSIDCSLYRGATNRAVEVGPVEDMTAGEAKELGYGLCAGCLKRLTSA